MSQVAISEVFKGGSMGKGTMVPGDFDVDQDVSITRIIIIFLDKPLKLYSQKCILSTLGYKSSTTNGHYY